MDECCRPRGYDRVFDSRQARRDAARYRKSGLSWGPRRTVELFKDGTISGRTMLEVGGGVGDLQVEMLNAGVESAMCVELSAGYDDAAHSLLTEAGLSDRGRRVVGDFAAEPDLAPPADLVVLHSVVCCYADAERLIIAAARRTRRYLVLSFPNHTWWLRLWAPVQNLYPRLRRSDFRFYVHPPAGIRSAAVAGGLREVHTERNWIDTLAVFAP